jgi:hypothetical protein
VEKRLQQVKKMMWKGREGASYKERYSVECCKGGSEKVFKKGKKTRYLERGGREKVMKER